MTRVAMLKYRSDINRRNFSGKSTVSFLYTKRLTTELVTIKMKKMYALFAWISGYEDVSKHDNRIEKTGARSPVKVRIHNRILYPVDFLNHSFKN